MVLGGLTKRAGIITSKVLANTTDDLRSAIDRHGGLAKPNRFSVFVKTPDYRFFNQNAASIAYGLSGGNFQSFFDDVRDVGILCESLVLPESRLNIFEYSDVRNSQKSPNGFSNTDFTITFTVTNDYYIPRMFKVWETSIVNRKTNRVMYKEDYARSIYVIGCDDNNIPNYIVKIDKAYPILQSELNYNQEEMNGNLRYTVTFTYEDFEEYSVNDMMGDALDFVDVGINKFNSISKFVSESSLNDIGKGVVSGVKDFKNYLIGESNIVNNYENSFVKKVVGRF